MAAGYEPTERRLDKRLEIMGVGNGTQYCDWEMRIPLAVPTASPDGRLTGDAREVTFEAPVVEGTGTSLPLILGLKSMQEKGGVLELDQSARIFTIPGPGGYKIEWAPGAIHIPLTPAMSSHLMIPCDKYKDVRHKGGLPAKEISLHATLPAAVAEAAGSPSR